MSDTITIPRCPICGQENPSSPPGFCARPSCGAELLPGTDERLRVRTFKLVNHFSLCVLPFAFADIDQEGVPVWERLAESGRWSERVFSLDNEDDVDRTEYFLPYIRRFLFPSMFRNSADKTGNPAGQSCWHFTFDLTRLGKLGLEGIPLTMHARDERKKLSLSCPLALERLELIVFSYRVGFLVFHYENREPGATYFDQMDGLNYLRIIAPLYKGFELPVFESGPERFRMTQLLPYLLAEFGSAAAPKTPAEMAETTPLPVKPTFDDRMLVYTFSCLDKETALADPHRCEALLRRAAVIGFDPEATTLPKDQVNAPKRDMLLARYQGFTKDGGGLVVFNTDRFHAQFMGIYHRTYYFDIFLLAALQRVTLLNLFESFSDIHALLTGSSASRKLLRRVRRDLLMFKNQCRFSQITNRERGLVLWKKWQSVFETKTLLREVNEQSDELNTYLQSRYRERMEMLVRLGGFLAATLPIILGLGRFFEEGHWILNLRWPLLGLLVLGSAIFGWFVLFWKRDEV